MDATVTARSPLTCRHGVEDIREVRGAWASGADPESFADL